MNKINLLDLRFHKKLYFILLLIAFSSIALSQQEKKSDGKLEHYVRQGEVKMHNNRPAIFINDRPVTPLLYALVDRRFSWFKMPQYNIKQFADVADVKLVQVDVFLDDIWFSDGSFKLDSALMQMRGVLDVVPDAGIFLRLHVNAPRWWQAQHPEESIVYGNTDAIGKGLFTQTWMNGDLSNVSRFSLASKKWISSASEIVRRFCTELSETPEGNALVSIQVACGVYGEWHYFGFLDNDPDLSLPMTNYFRDWLKKKYKTDEVLQKAWANNSVSLETAEVPGTRDRNATSYGIFRDPVKERNVIDYFEAQHLVVAEDILHFCKLIKENWPRPIITGSFYGYFYSLFGREAAGGHLAVDTVLSSPYIDFLAGPQAYYPDNEATGEPYHSRGLLESVRLHGKLWLEEMDQEPPLVNKADSNYDASVKESIARVRRNMMFTATKGMGMWFYDFGLPISGQKRIRQRIKDGYWNQPDIMAGIRKMKDILDINLKSPYVSDADVLMVYDTHSFYSLVSQTNKTNMTNVLINWTATNSMKAGVVFDAIYLSDLEKVDLSQYKVVVFNNTFVLNEKQREFIHERVMRDKRDVIWFYAPGYSDDTRLSTEFISQLTGINIVPADTSTLPVIKTTALMLPKNVFDIRDKPKKGRTAILGNYTLADYDAPYLPLFSIKDQHATTLGVFTSNNTPAVAKKELGDCTSWFVAIPSYEPALMSGLLHGTKAHIFSRDGVIVYSGSGLLSVHTKNSGIKTIVLSNGRSIKLNMEENSTFILNNKTGEVLLGNVILTK